MKQLFLLFFLMCLSANAQDYSRVDAKARGYTHIKSAKSLASKIAVDFNNDGDKIRAAFIWLTHNIRYDLEEYYNPTTKSVRFSYKNEADKQQKLQQIKDEVVNEMFRTRKSVCEGYAQSFKKICDLLNIESVVIKGYARNSTGEIGQIPTRSNHAWNVVKIGNKWQLIDATWAAGYAINNQWKKHYTEYYFYPKPEELLRTHYPDQQQWQLVRRPISKSAYANQPIIGQGFFSKSLLLVSPKKGVLPAQKTTFQIRNLSPNHIVGYLFKGQKYGQRAKVSIQNGIGNFSIDLTQKKNSELYIFIDSEIALEYKIK